MADRPNGFDPRYCINGHPVSPETRTANHQCLYCRREQSKRNYRRKRADLGLPYRARGPYKGYTLLPEIPLDLELADDDELDRKAAAWLEQKGLR